MEIVTFVDNLKRLMFSTKEIIINKVNYPKSFFLIQDFNIKNFINFTYTENGIEFSFYQDEKEKYLIKKDDELLEDPPLYSYRDLESVYLNHSSSFFLIEIAKNISDNNKFNYTHHKFDIYQKVRQFFPVLIMEKGYLTSIRLSNDLDAFLLTYSDVRFTIVSKTQEVLEKILSELNIKIESSQKNVAYSSKVIIDGVVNDSMIKGKLNFQDKKIDIEIEKDKVQKVDFSIKRWMNKLSDKKMDEIKYSVSKEIIQETFSQTDNTIKEVIEERIKSLYADLVVNKLIFADDCVTIEYKSMGMYPDYSINCLLDENLQIEDCYIG